MFLGHLLTFEDRQKLLKLYGWKIIDASPKYLESSKMVCGVRHVRTKYGAREQVYDILFPRIRAKTVLRLFKNLRRGQRGMLLEQISILFELGLGVPKQKQIADYILHLDNVDDQEVGIKYIGKLIKQYIANYKFSMDDHDYMYCAQFTEQLLLMKKFIGKTKQNVKKSVRVPEGKPCVMVYSLTDFNGAKFSLVDAYAFSSNGFPIPISTSVMRKEFGAVPRQFNSYALKSHGQYMLVFGILHWNEDGEENFQHMQTLDDDEYEVLVDHYDKYCSKELLALRKFRNVDREVHNAHRHAIEVLAVKEDATKKERRLVSEAETYFAEREKAVKQLSRLERKAASKLAESGPVVSAQFFALDIGAIGISRKLRTLVSTPPETLAKSLTAWGFTTALNANPKCLSSRIYYGVTSTRRSWQIETEKK